MFRLKIPKLIEDAQEIAIKPKDDDDVTMGMMDTTATIKKPAGSKKAIAGTYQLKATVDWQQFTNRFADTPREKLQQQLSMLLLQVPLALPAPLLNGYVDQSNRNDYIRTMTIQMMSTPEYQLC